MSFTTNKKHLKVHKNKNNHENFQIIINNHIFYEATLIDKKEE